MARVAELVVRLDVPGLLGAHDLPPGPVHAGPREHAPDVFQADSVLVQGGRVQVDTHRRQRGAADEDLTHARYLGQLLHHDARRGVIHLGGGERVRGEGDDENGRVRGVDLAVEGGCSGGSGAKIPGPH